MIILFVLVGLLPVLGFGWWAGRNLPFALEARQKRLARRLRRLASKDTTTKIKLVRIDARLYAIKQIRRNITYPKRYQ